MHIYSYFKTALLLLSVLSFLVFSIIFQIIPLKYTLIFLLFSLMILGITFSAYKKFPTKFFYYFKECLIILIIITFMISSIGLYRLNKVALDISYKEDDVLIISNSQIIDQVVLGVFDVDLKIVNQISQQLNPSDIKHYSSLTNISNALIDNEITHLIIHSKTYHEISDFHFLKKETHQVESVSLDPNYRPTKESFNILLSGIDTLASPYSDNRSDMNMLISVNLATQEILFTSIPRDLYVKNPCLNNAYDKLCHVSIYSMNCLVNSFNTFIDTDIDYYARISFSSVINIIDALNGLEIDVPKTFREYDEYKRLITVNNGLQTLDGKQVLALARHRKSLPNGDLDRNKNQQHILKALLKKIAKLENVFLVNDVLSILEDNVYTNLTIEDLYYFLTYANTLNGFKIYSQSINGYFENKETASMRGYMLAVVVMKQNNIKDVNTMIEKVLAPKTMDGFVFNLNEI